MRSIGHFIFLLLLTAQLAHGANQEAPQYPDHSRLTIYLDSSGAEHPVRTPEDWAVRRRHIVEGMERAMGPLPDRSKFPPLDMRVREEFQGDGYVRQTISFTAEPPDRVPAHLYLPDRRPEDTRSPAMLALHPTSVHGKGRVTAAGGEPNRGYGSELARRGYVVIAPDHPPFGDYKKYDFAADPYVSGSMKGIVNCMRCVDLLAARDDVDPERIGVIGHSLGGHNAMFAAAFDQRLKVTVSSCGWTPFHDYRGAKLGPWAQECYMPLLRNKYRLDPDRVPFDFYEVVAALAPRAFFSNSPLHDSNFDVAGVKKATAKAHPVFKLLGAADRLEVRHPDCGHDFPPEVRREAYAFIDRVLNHTPTHKVP